ncbi:vWA domain-containing protein [Neomoorella thermoacetica]|nr:VWA-like domain-containing protein [Moorella thermoacetica]
MINLLTNYPFYGALATSMQVVSAADFPYAAVKAGMPPVLYVNPDSLQGLRAPERLGVFIHELLHLILLHFGRQSGRDQKLWNIACDLAVNQLVLRGGEKNVTLPCDAITVHSLEKDLGIDLPRNAGAEVYYDILDKHLPRLKITVVNNQIKVELNVNGEKREYTASQILEGDDSNLDKELMKGYLNKLIEQAKQVGSMPGHLEVVLKDLYAPPQVDWRRVLRRFLAGRGKMLNQQTWLKESRRFEGFPGRSKRVGMTALLAIDTSGSISDNDLQVFLNEIRAVSKITGTKVWVTQCDVEPTAPIELKRFVKNPRFTGRGGTDFRPVFKMADEMHVPLVIYLTDGYGTAPEIVHQRVLWVLTKDHRVPADYGTSVVLGVS